MRNSAWALRSAIDLCRSDGDSTRPLRLAALPWGCSDKDTTGRFQGPDDRHDGTDRVRVVSLIGPGTSTSRRLGAIGGGSGVVVGGATGLVEVVRVQNGRGRGINVVGEGTQGTLRRVRVADTSNASNFRPAEPRGLVSLSRQQPGNSSADRWLKAGSIG